MFKIGRKMTGGLQRKLRATISITVLLAILIIFSVVAYYYMGMYRERRMADITEQMELMTSELKFFQSLMDNVAKQVITNVAVSDSLDSGKDSRGIYLYKKRRANEALGSYAHVVEPIHEILIYSAENDTYTSQSTIRSAFIAEDNPWYTEFKKKGKTSGFTAVHDSVAMTSGYTEDVISYVMTFYRVDNPSIVAGDLIINIRYSYLRDLLSTSNELVSAVALFDSNKRAVYQSGEDTISYQETVDSGDNNILVSPDLEDSWILALKISNRVIQKEINTLLIRLAITFMLVGVLIYVILSRFVDRIVEPIKVLAEKVDEVGKGNFDVNVEIKSNDEIEELANGFNTMVLDIKDLMEESVENEKIKRKMTVDKLINQINPHFIYNTLNSIVYMAKIDGNEKIVDFTNTFISLLQGTLKIQDTVFIPIGEELVNIENYLKLQEYRYADKFDVDISCSEADKKALIPNVMLEPIVENAIFHGIAPAEEKGHLEIGVKREDDMLSITVSDDGIGMDEETVARVMSDTTSSGGAIHKIGVANVRKRIKQIYGDDYDIAISSAPEEGTTFFIRIPYREET